VLAKFELISPLAMKRILVPTDFSKPAENALAFAN